MEKVSNPKELDGNIVALQRTDIFKALNQGKSVAWTEGGNSLYPIIKSAQYVLLTPIKSLDEVNIGDIVFCTVNGQDMVHMVLMKTESSASGKPLFLIGSSNYNFYGWTDDVYAKAKGMNYLDEDILELEKY